MNAFQYIFNPKVMLSSAVVVAGLIFGFSFVSQSGASASQDCDNNAVMRCGFSGLGEFVTKYNQNQNGDVQTLYAHPFRQGYGITPSELNTFTQNARPATFYRNGVIAADGKTIAVDGASLGRETNNGNTHSIPINGETYYWGYNGSAFAPGTNSIPGYVMINPDDHSMKFGVISSCGNPAWGTSPGYKCTMLNKEQTGRNTFNFSTTEMHRDGATVNRVVYDFGDGTPTVTQTNPAEKVSHTYTRAGDFTARVTVYFNVFDRQESDTRADCTKPVHVEEEKKPIFACKNLTIATVKKEEREYSFTVTSQQANGPKLAKADFGFGDGQTAQGIVSTNGTTAVTTHSYSKTLEGVITITATVYADTGDIDAGDNKCTATLDFGKRTVVFTCKSLVATIVNAGEREYSFTVTSESNGPKLARADFDFGDGQTVNGIGSTDGKTVTTPHKYAKTLEGDITITATVHADEAGVDANNNKCTAKLSFPKQPPATFACNMLEKSLVNTAEREYKFVVTSESNGPKLVKADFGFGDGQTALNIASTDGKTATTTHKFAKTLEGEKTINAVVYADNGKVDAGNSKCVVKITFEKPPQECKPGIPVGDARCKDECKPGIPVGDKRCAEEVHVLPSTGPAEMIGSAVGVSGLAAASMYYHNSRRGLRSLLNKFKR